MATAQNGPINSGIAGADLSAFRFGVRSGNTITTNTTAGGFVDGIINETVLSGQEVGLVVMDGAIRKVEAGAAIAADASVSSAADGQAITATSGHAIMGKALDAATAEGDIIRVILGYRGQQT